MSQLDSLLDQLIADPEIRALLDQAQAGSSSPPRSPIDLVTAGQEGLRGGVLSGLNRDAGLAGGQLLALSPDQFESVRRSALNVDRLGELGTPPLSFEQLGTFIGQQTADPRAGGVPTSFQPPASAQIIGGPNAPATSLATNLRQGFGSSVGEQQGFLTQEGAGQIDAQRRQQIAEQQALAEQQSPVNQVIQQLADAFGGENRIPPIGSSFLGIEPAGSVAGGGLSGRPGAGITGRVGGGAATGTTRVYGVTAGNFVVGRFDSQEAADQARDALRGALRQGPAPPPGISLPSGVLSPFGRTGAQQFDDARAFSQEQRLAFKALEEAGVPVGRAFAGFGGGRAGGRAGGGRMAGAPAFTTTKRAVPLAGGLGFTFINKISELNPLGVPGGLPVTGREQDLLDILNGELGGRTALQVNRLLQGGQETIARLFDEELITDDQALVAEVLRSRLDGITKNPGEKPAAFQNRFKRLLGIAPTNFDVQNAADFLVHNPDDLNSQLLRQIGNEADAVAQAQIEAGRKDQATVRFTERETKPERETRRSEALNVAAGVREDARLDRESRQNESREFRLATIEAAAIAANDRNRISQIQQRIRPLMRELGRLQATLAAENRKEAKSEQTLSGFQMLGGPDPATQLSLKREIDELDTRIEQMIGSQTLTQGVDPRARVLRSQTQPAVR